MLYILCGVLVLCLIIPFVWAVLAYKYVFCRKIIPCICFMVAIASFLLILVCIASVLFGGGFSDEYKTVSSEKNAVTSYEKLKTYSDLKEIGTTIVFSTEQEDYKLADEKVEISITENGSPKYVTIENREYFNFILFYTETRQAYIFTEH